MSDFYKLVAIDGKGFGCVATKKIKPGTLIFSEKSAVTALGNCSETVYFKTIHAKGSRNFTMLELFLNEGEVFAKAHAKVSKIKNGYLTEEIKQRSENCKQWMDQQAQNQKLQSDFMAMFLR